MRAPPIFVGGAPRSGLTLLRAMLDSHPGIACGPDLLVLPTIALKWQQFHKELRHTHERFYHLSPDQVRQHFATLIDTFFADLLAATGKRRAAEKSSINALAFGPLASLFPDSPLVHVIRDGRDVVASLLARDWRDPRTGQPLPYTQDAGQAATYWASFVQHGRAAASHPDAAPRYHELRYEALVRAPQETLGPLLDAIGEPWSETVLRFHETERVYTGMETASAAALGRPLSAAAVGRWRRDLDPAQRAAVKRAAGPLLVDLGYSRDLNW